MARIGDLLDEKYRIVREIGQGGMAVVYLAVDLRLNKNWAVKEIRRNGSSEDRIYLKSLMTEAEVIKNFDHPVLPRIVDIINANNAAYIVMDYIEGMALNVLLKQEGPQCPELVVKWTKSLLEALIYLHGMNPPVIYGDMKPSNIILKPDGNVKLIDFGTAAFGRDGYVSGIVRDEDKQSEYRLGTYGYASPEQLGLYKDCDYVDERSDIYSLGATMYTLLTGKVPERTEYKLQEKSGKDTVFWLQEKLQKDSTCELQGKLRGDTVCKISSGLYKIIDKCMQFDPKDRYQSCQDMLKHLVGYEKGNYINPVVHKNSSVGVFLLSVLMGIVSVGTALYGYQGIARITEERYADLLDRGYCYVIEEQYDKALAMYKEAICETNGERKEAYEEMLKVYTDYLDEAEEGIDKVSYYVLKECGKGDSRTELLMQLGLQCFEKVKDYKKSAYYFGLAKQEGYPEADLYRNICEVLSELKIDGDKLSVSLKEFEKMAESQTDVGKKLDDYILICDILLKQGAEIEDSMTELIKYSEEGLNLLDSNNDDTGNVNYYISFYQYLVSGYEGAAYYNEALEYCDLLLQLVSGDESAVMGSVKAGEFRKGKLNKKAELLVKLSRFEEACGVYEMAEKEYEEEGEIFYIGHLALLCQLEEEKTSDIEKWNSEKICEIYEKGNAIEGIDEDYRWKRLKVKLMPLLEKGG